MTKFNLTDRFGSFKFALRGLARLIQNEHNARIHLAATLVVTLFGFLFKLNLLEWSLVLIAIAIVFITEILNTAIEKLADFVEPKWNKRIGEIKDYGAAAVLIAAIVACALGLIIFLPKVLEIVQNWNVL